MKKEIVDAFFGGQSINSYELFGAHLASSKNGVQFTVYAPAAQSIQVIGTFNGWGEYPIWFEKVDERGIWTVYVEHAKEHDLYKYRVCQIDGTYVDKMDPYAFYSELRPNTASIVVNQAFRWGDSRWMKKRTRCFNQPMNIYELQVGAWMHLHDGINYRSIAQPLINYLHEMHYTHIEFMPLSEYPFDGSWGYQTSGYFSVTSRYGTLQDLKYLINELHKNDIGVIFDFVPVHFVMDNYALRKFDGTSVYEYEYDHDAYSQWGTANFDLNKESVRSFLMSAAGYWLDILHGDGLRIDAVSNIIYWQGNRDRGINEGALTFIRRMNEKLHSSFHEVIIIAEDSSDFPNVTGIHNDSLGFDYKWDLGWMNDTLEYFKMDPIYRQYHHNKINFSMAYFYSENFILPFSHDEVVHGKATIVNKMWGTYEQKFAQARLLYTYMFTHPGKKLNFMGNELGHLREFDESKALDWFLLEYPMHDSFKRFIRDLQAIYSSDTTFYEDEYKQANFKWIDADNAQENIFSYMRIGKDTNYVVILNMSNMYYHEHCFGVNESGYYKEILNSDQDIYSGLHRINEKALRAKKQRNDDQPYYINVNVAPFSGIILRHKNNKK